MIQLYIHIYTFFFRFFSTIVHLFNWSTLIRCVVVFHCDTDLHFPNRQWGASQVAPQSRICLPMQETQEIQVWSLGREDHLEEEMATHSRILAWEIPRTEEPGRLQSMRSKRAGHNWGHTHTQIGHDVGYLFMGLFAIYILFVCVCEVSAFIFRPFKKLGCLFSYCWEFKYSYILDTSVLSDMWHANIVSQLAVCYFISYKVSLTEETIWILLKSNRSILSSMDYAFGVTPKCNWTCKWLMATPSFSCGQGWPCHPVLANRTCSCKRSFNVSHYGCSAPSSGLFHLSSWSEVVIVLLWPWDRPHPGIAQWKAKDNAL